MRALIAIALFGSLAAPAAADETWSCAVTEDGKPQVVKFLVTKAGASISDRALRLFAEFGTDKKGTMDLRIVENDKTSFVAIGSVYANREMGTTASTSITVYAIDKKTGALTMTRVSTSEQAIDIKGNCAR